MDPQSVTSVLTSDTQRIDIEKRRRPQDPEVELGVMQPQAQEC